MAKLGFLALLVVSQIFSASAQTLIGGATSVNAILSGLAPTSPVKYTYASVGSGAGRSGFIAGTYLVCSSDNAFLPAEDVAYCAAKKLPAPSATNVGHYTLPYVVIGFGVFVSTNAVLGTSPSKSTLSMTPTQVATIFSDNAWDGTSACNWNTIYPGKNVNLIYFVRCESSGTTKVFTTYLTLYGGSAWTYGNAFSLWPGLTACTVNPPSSAQYKRCGQPSLNSYTMASSLAGCVGTGCVTYIQAGYGKGKGTSAGQPPVFLSEVSIPNKAGVLLTSSNCLISQAIPSIAPTNKQNWAALDGSLLTATGAKTCPLVALNYLNAAFSYGGNPNPKKLLQYLFGVGYKAPYFISKAATVIPLTYKTKAVAAIATIA